MIEVSASKITTYMDCPLKYRFRYIDRIEPEETQPGLALGSAFHRTVKLFYKRLMDGQRITVEQAEAAFKQDWEVAQTVPIAWNGNTPEEMETQGVAMLNAYLEAALDPVVPVAVEQELRTPLVNLVTGETMEGVELIGILDRINPDNNPVEFKTSSKSWSQMQADQSLQMSVYAYMVGFLGGRDEVNGTFEVLVKNKTPKLQRITTIRTPRHFDQLYRTVDQVIRSIRDGIYFPKPSYFCPSCDYCVECANW